VPRWVPIETLAAEPPWEAARALALPGHCRGALLRDWAAHVSRRAGPGAVERLRAHLGLGPDLLPDHPPAERWYPVGYQLALTRAIIDLALGGDALALEPLLAEDTARARDKVLLFALRTLGPRRVLRGTSKVHAHLYDVGRAEADVADSSARLSFRGAAMFADPTWRILQLFAVRGMLRGFRRDLVELVADPEGEDRFTLQVAWR
jgi:hypothetical protein